MRSGSDWVGTNWRANQSQVFHFSASRVGTTRKIKISWWMTTECNDSASSPTYYLCYKSQTLKVNGKTEVNWGGTNPSYNSDGHTVYRGFADKNSYLDKHYNGKVFYDTNGDYTGIKRYVQILGTKWITGSFEKPADNDGNIWFTVSGSFGWDGTTNLDFSKKFVVKGLIPEATFTIRYDKNNEAIKNKSTIINVPSVQTKKLDKNIKLSTVVPVDSKQNFEFAFWATASNSSSLSPKPGATVYKPGDTYSINKDLTLYAIWTRNLKTLTYSLDGGSWDNFTPTTKVPYSYSTTLPTKVKKYGCTLNQWYSSKYGKYFLPGSSYNAIYDDTLTAQYSNNIYNINLLDIDGKIMPDRIIPARFNAVIYGDFTYNAPGYECIGWSTYSADGKTIILDYNTPAPPIVPNIVYSTAPIYGRPSPYTSPNIYIGAGVYRISPRHIFNVSTDPTITTSRLHMVGKNINLYPVLRYKTSYYIYTQNNKWVLAQPYVYQNVAWNQSVGYINSNNGWKK